MNGNRFFPRTDAVGLMRKQDRTAWLKCGKSRCAVGPRPLLDRAWRMVLLGAPGVGKGTQAERLSERLGACHLSTGDIFRAAKSCNGAELSPAMSAALDQMRRGELVSDETVLAMIAERVRCLNCSGGFLLDGFPRTVTQAEALEQLLENHGRQLTAVLNYELPVEKIIARLAGRRTCAGCHAVYHVTTQPPRIADVCDACGQNLIQREDDRPESVAVRMAAYKKSTRPLIDFYQQRSLLVNILAEGTPEEIYQRTRLSVLAL